MADVVDQINELREEIEGLRRRMNRNLVPWHVLAVSLFTVVATLIGAAWHLAALRHDDITAIERRTAEGDARVADALHRLETQVAALMERTK